MMVKRLSELMLGIDSQDWQLVGDDVEVNGLHLDCRHIQSGNVFFAISGQNFSAKQFVNEAVNKGAIAICCDADSLADIQAQLEQHFPIVSVRNLKAKLSRIAGVFYGKPSAQINIIAITGTDGKTSVSNFIAQALVNAAVIGTLGNGVMQNANSADLLNATHTTPDAITLQSLLHQFIGQGVQHVAMEASSHGLDQHRLDGLDIDTAVLTNFSRDHLDYHKTVAAYKAAKMRLFEEFDVKNIVVNLDDLVGDEIYRNKQSNAKIKTIGFSLDKSKLADDVVVISLNKILSTGFNVDVLFQTQRKNIRINLLGEFNLANAACVCAVLLQYFSFDEVCRRLENLQSVTGRMQTIKRNDVLVVIDYAHTPQALAAAIKAVQQHAQGNVICLFGCGGDRDKGKRPLMAQSALQANFVVVTNDNPRTENPEDIVEHIVAGFHEFDAYQVELDRKQAIHLALDKAQSNDVVLIAGKGHEDYQIIGTEKYSFSDEAVVREYFQDAA